MGDLNLKESLGLSAAGSGIGTALGGVGAVIGSALQMRNWKKQFDMQNAYNSPKAQLERLYDAGINPLYNSDFSGNSAAALSAAAPAVQSNNPAFVEDFARFREAKFNQSLQDIQTEYWKYKAENEKQQARKTGAEADVIPIRNQKEMQEIEAHTKFLLAEKDKSAEQFKEIRANIQNMKVYQRIAKDKLNLLLRSFRLEKRKFGFEQEARRFSNATDRMNAVTNANLFKFESGKKFDLEVKKYKLDEKIQNSMVKNREEELRQKAKELSDKEFSDFVDKATSNVMGVKFTNTNDIVALWTLYQALGNTLESGEQISDVKALAINHACDVLNNAIRQNLANQAKTDLKGIASGFYNMLQNSDDSFKQKWGLQKGKFDNYKPRPFFPTGME